MQANYVCRLQAGGVFALVAATDLLPLLLDRATTSCRSDEPIQAVEFSVEIAKRRIVCDSLLYLGALVVGTGGLVA